MSRKEKFSLLEVRGERLDVKNGFATFARAYHICGLDRGKKQEIASYGLAQIFKTLVLPLASSFLASKS